tara:strand:- start:719 stop:1033 length:315 start_codon:yes stop_codon:yes gene_type:complete
MNLDLEIILECGCSPGKKFKSKVTYNNHFKSQKHIKWENDNMIRNYKKDTTEYENIISSYKLKIKNLEIENSKLYREFKKKEIIIEYYIKNFVIIQIILLLKYS